MWNILIYMSKVRVRFYCFRYRHYKIFKPRCINGAALCTISRSPDNWKLPPLRMPRCVNVNDLHLSAEAIWSGDVTNGGHNNDALWTLLIMNAFRPVAPTSEVSETSSKMEILTAFLFMAGPDVYFLRYNKRNVLFHTELRVHCARVTLQWFYSAIKPRSQ